MRTGWLVLAGWGAALLALMALGVLGFGLDALPAGLLGAAGVAAVLAGAAAGVAGRRRERPLTDAEPRLLVDSSLASFAVAAGVVLALVGIGAVGTAFFWPGVGLSVLGAAGIVRERRAARRALIALEEGAR